MFSNGKQLKRGAFPTSDDICKRPITVKSGVTNETACPPVLAEMEFCKLPVLVKEETTNVDTMTCSPSEAFVSNMEESAYQLEIVKIEQCCSPQSNSHAALKCEVPKHTEACVGNIEESPYQLEIAKIEQCSSLQSNSHAALKCELKKRKKVSKGRYALPHHTRLSSRPTRQKHSKLKDKVTKSSLSDSLGNKTKCVIRDAKAGKLRATFLLDLLWGYGRENPTWSESSIRFCLILYLKSPCVYSYIRRCNLIPLPSPSDLKRYMGYATMANALPSVVQHRLYMELASLQSDNKMASLIFEDVAITAKRDPSLICWMRSVTDEVTAGFGDVPAIHPTRLLCFLLQGSSLNYVIPVAYYLLKEPNAVLMHSYLMQVLNCVEKFGVKVVRIQGSTTNESLLTLKRLCGGMLQPKIDHPLDLLRPLFISCDPAEIIKDVWLTLLDDQHCMVNNGEVLSVKPLKELFLMQIDFCVMPELFLTRKHLFPVDKEKRNVKRAVETLSHRSRHLLMSTYEFTNASDVQETVKFMEYMENWFRILSVLNRKLANDRVRISGNLQILPLNKENIDWLIAFLEYLQAWRLSCKSEVHFLERDLYAAITVTIAATFMYIRYLTDEGLTDILSNAFRNGDIEYVNLTVEGVQSQLNVEPATESKDASLSCSADVQPGPTSGDGDSELSVIHRRMMRILVMFYGGPSKYCSRQVYSMVNFWKWAVRRNFISLQGRTEQDFEESFHYLMHLNNAELANSMVHFICEARRRDGHPYTPSSLFQIITGVHDFYISHGRHMHFFRDVAFFTLKQMLKAKFKYAKGPSLPKWMLR